MDAADYEIVALRRAPGIISQLAQTLVEAVANGASVSFMHPLAPEAAAAFWTNRLPRRSRRARGAGSDAQGDLAGTVTFTSTRLRTSRTAARSPS